MTEEEVHKTETRFVGSILAILEVGGPLPAAVVVVGLSSVL